MNNNWLSYSPHLKSNSSVNKIYLLFIIALVPALMGGLVRFGMRAFLVVGLACLSAFLCHIIVSLFKYKKVTFYDISSIYSGLLIGLIMPPNIHLLAPVVASIFAVIVVKGLSGGTNQNYVNEVVISKVLIAIMFGVSYFKFIDPLTGVESAENITEKVLNGANHLAIKIFDVVFDGVAGGIGETSILWLLVGGVFLCAAKVIDYKVPLVYLITVFALGYLLFGITEIVILISASGIVLVAFFILTDYATSPKKTLSSILFSLVAGLLTIAIWKWGKNVHLAGYYAAIITSLCYAAFKGVINLGQNKERRKA